MCITAFDYVRPDIAYAVHVVSQFMHAVKRIFRYLQGTLTHGLFLRPSTSPSIVIAYSDADWAGCKDSCRSTTGYAIYLGPNMIAWHSKKRPTVSRSSTKAEYRPLGYIQLLRPSGFGSFSMILALLSLF